jgi:hypothetical protein
MRCIAFLALLLAAGCAHRQRPYRFTLAARDDAVDVVAQALAAQGLEPVLVNREGRGAGVIRTGWRDTGFLFGDYAGQNATLVRRYIITVERFERRMDVTVRADVVRCAAGSFVVRLPDEGGVCDALRGTVPTHQRELEQLGASLQRSTGG